MVCISLGAVIILGSDIVSDYAAKKVGRNAFYQEDYETCYQTLYGKKLNESEKIMYGKSESILRMRLWIIEYELFLDEDLRPQALDSLIQSVNAFPDLFEYAGQFNAGSDVSTLYTQLLEYLSDQFQLTEDEALEIAANKDDVDYSRMVYAIADGQAFGSWNEQSVTEEPQEKMVEDSLPEEEEMEDIQFIDNN